MPIYEYKCTKCGHVFEVITGFAANGTRKCSKCGAAAKRLISAPQVVFHGSGFYSTDHKRACTPASSAKSAGKEKAAEGKPQEEPSKECKSADTKRQEAS